MNFPKLTNTVKMKAMSLFIALSLSVTWYFTVRPLAMGIPGNATNFWVFSAMSKSNYHMDTLGVWRPRLASLWITGRLLDSIVKNGQINAEDYQNHKIVLLKVERQDTQGAFGRYFYLNEYQNIYGVYHACWLFVLFCVMIVFLENPVFIILGTFAGLIYMLTPEAAYYAYSWDMPSVTIFMVCFFLWQRKKYNVMLAVLVAGTIFKETSAVTAVLYFFTDMPIWRRVKYFVGAIVLVFLLKIISMELYYGKIILVTQDIHAAGPIDELGWFYSLTAWANFKALCTLTWNHFIWTNAGTCIIALFLPMRSLNEIGTKALILVFLLCQFFAGSVREFRDFLEVLPLTMIYLFNYINRLQNPAISVTAGEKQPAPKSLPKRK
jgi:hypothetical protein